MCLREGGGEGEGERGRERAGERGNELKRRTGNETREGPVDPSSNDNHRENVGERSLHHLHHHARVWEHGKQTSHMMQEGVT